MADKNNYLTIRIPDSERARLEQLATANDRTLAAEVRRAIRAHLDAQTSA